MSMGTVAMKIRVMPEGPEVDLVALELAVKEAVTTSGADLHAIEIKPFAFGLKSMEMAVIMPDAGGGTPDAIEEALSALDGVQSVEVLEVGLL
jgi:elongation factor 1-beta